MQSEDVHIKDIYVKSLKVENYKSLKESEIEFSRGLNIIIGQNGVGKSNLLEFILMYADYFPHIFISEMDNNFRLLASGFSISYGYVENNKSLFFSYTIERKKGENGNSNVYNITLSNIDENKTVLSGDEFIINTRVGNNEYPEFRKIWRHGFKMFQDIQIICIPFSLPQNLLWLAEPHRIIINLDNSWNIGKNSDLLFFKELESDLDFGIFEKEIKSKAKHGTDAIKKRIISFLSKYLSNKSVSTVLNHYTVIKEIRFNPNINVYLTDRDIIIENLLVDFFVDGNWLPWSYLSDGTKRLFYLISESIALKEGILLIEEPELGIHPHQLYKILDFLKEQSREKQIIITTHSPLALDVLDETELNRIIIAKYDNGSKFRHLSKEEISKAKKYMHEVGELSYYWLHSDLEE